VVDKADEIMDYASSKPYFQKWSEDIAKDTDGKSLGNVRSMHGKVATGKLTGIDFNDTEKAIDVCAKVVDDNEWQKVLEGVYTGFSIGGSYVGKKAVEKMDGREVARYTANPNEVSLVDRPCIPTAKFFDVQKADGTLAKVEFKAQAEDAELIVNGSADEVASLAKMMNEQGLSMADVLKKLAPAITGSGDVVLAGTTAAPAAAPVVEKLDAGALRKGFWMCAELAGVLSALSNLKSSAAYEAYYEGDNSPIPQRIAALIAMTGQVLKEMIDEEVGEAADTAEAVILELAAKAGDLAKFESGDPFIALLKVGARNSATDKDRISKIHDLVIELGHECAAEKSAPAGDLTKGAALAKADIEKMLADAVAPLQKALDESNAKVAKLESQPAPARISLRAIAKSDDVDGNAAAPAAPAPITDAHGEKHEAASLIKQLHNTGGQPLVGQLRK
jgi:hypothetical protein